MSLDVLAINGGSSSLKFALFERADSSRRVLSGEIERIGLSGTVLRSREEGVPEAKAEPFGATDLVEAACRLLEWLGRRVDLSLVVGIGHRIVHGGPLHRRAQRITLDLIEELRRLGPLDPAHLPGEVAVADLFVRRFPRVPQVACFDTSFHRNMPRVAQLLPVPRVYEEAGIRRYGFHGLSYAYVLGELARVAGPTAARGRLVLAHLGAGSSMAAVRDGACVDTTMAFTPTAGLVMGTRSGDLDPGLLVYFLREGMTTEQVDELVNRRSGLLGVSGVSSDMKDLLERESTDTHAAEAIDLFCYQAAKYAAAMAVAAGGMDTLVFTGGIGERAAPIRARICARLEMLGVRLDAERNAATAPLVSLAGSAAAVRVIKTDEEITIARQTYAVLGSGPPGLGGEAER
jgi:acetate kinase